MGERLSRLGEKIRDNKAESAWIALGATALVYEAIAPDRNKDLLSHAAYRHQIVTLGAAAILVPHFLRVPERLGVPELDLISHAAKWLSRGGDVEV